MIHCDSTYAKFKSRPNRSLVMEGRIQATSVVAWEGAGGLAVVRRCPRPGADCTGARSVQMGQACRSRCVQIIPVFEESFPRVRSGVRVKRASCSADGTAFIRLLCGEVPLLGLETKAVFRS